GAGHRPRPPHRTDPPGTGAPPDRRRHRRRAHRRHAGSQTRPRRGGARLRRGRPQRTDRHRTRRTGGTEEEPMSGTDAEARGFPAFPAVRGRGGTARTWWGRAWIGAVEQAALDADQLRAGRAYARTGRVGSIAVSPGQVFATVDATEGTLRVSVSVRTLTDTEWDRFAAEAAARAGHIAALLDHDMPRDLVQAAEEAGVRLLPRDDELDFACDCPDWDHPCRHAAALCHQFAWLLDRDPFLLLLLRGRAEHTLVHQPRRVRTPASGAVESAAPVLDGEDAARAWHRPVPPLPEPVAPPQNTGAPPALPETEELDVTALRQLAADTAHRAAALLRGEKSTALDVWQDTV